MRAVRQVSQHPRPHVVDVHGAIAQVGIGLRLKPFFPLVRDYSDCLFRRDALILDFRHDRFLESRIAEHVELNPQDVSLRQTVVMLQAAADREQVLPRCRNGLLEPRPLHGRRRRRRHRRSRKQGLRAAIHESFTLRVSGGNRPAYENPHRTSFGYRPGQTCSKPSPLRKRDYCLRGSRQPPRVERAQNAGLETVQFVVTKPFGNAPDRKEVKDQ